MPVFTVFCVSGEILSRLAGCRIFTQHCWLSVQKWSQDCSLKIRYALMRDTMSAFFKVFSSENPTPLSFIMHIHTCYQIKSVFFTKKLFGTFVLYTRPNNFASQHANKVQYFARVLCWSGVTVGWHGKQGFRPCSPKINDFVPEIGFRL